jgi:pimeloyl-ACP methyl ester carboxylesterase
MMIAALVVGGGLALLWGFTALYAQRIEELFPALGKRVDLGLGAIEVLDRAAQGAEPGGEPDAVLLVHGTSTNSADMMVALGDRLSAKGYRVLSVDRPGHGWSDRVASLPQGQADKLRRAAVQLGAAQAVVVAHSLGAVVALAMALEAPAFVRALVLIAPVSHPWPGKVTWYYPVGARPIVGALFRHLVVLPAGLAVLREAVASVFAPNSAPGDFIRATRLPLVLRPLHFLHNCQDVVGTHAAVVALSPNYPTIRAPTEIVTGDCDHVIDASIHSAGCARDIKSARLTVLAGVGHPVHHVVPDTIVDIILRADRRATEAQAAAAQAGLAGAGLLASPL